MKKLYQDILECVSQKKKLLAVLIDPDKMDVCKVASFIKKVNSSIATHIFVGGSIVEEALTENLVQEIKKFTKLPIVLFPGDVAQISNKADALLFLSLISGRNSEYLIGKHVEAISKFRDSKLEVIPTGYILIDGAKETSVQIISKTVPIASTDAELALHTAIAAMYMGKQLIYLEAGSGAKNPVPTAMIKKISKNITIPLIVGGGIRTQLQLENAYKNGADVVVIGTAFEENNLLLDNL